MHHPNDFKRVGPRVTVEKLASEIVRENEELGLVVDLSSRGLRLERRSFARRDGRIVQLEFELPEVDEIVWAKGEVCFDKLRPSPNGPVRSTGIRLVAAATRHLRMLKDWVHATVEARRGFDDNPLLYASHWGG